MDRNLEIHRDEELGLRPHYFHEGSVTHAPTVAELYKLAPSLSRKPDAEGLRQYFERKPDGRRTCFSEISKVPLDCRLEQKGARLFAAPMETLPRQNGTGENGALRSAIQMALDRTISASRRPALALSGGLDSALLLALCREHRSKFTIVTLATSLSGYCERKETLATAKALGFSDVHVIEADAGDFVEALPAAIAAAETPLYNLHPVSKWLLACELRRLGFDLLVTGDGADQVFAGADSRNYLPIVGAMTRVAGIEMVCPFLDARVRTFQPTGTPDSSKSTLRPLAMELLPGTIVERKKQPRFAPDFDLSHCRTAAGDASLADILSCLPAPVSPGPSNTLWATATLLYQQLGVFA